MQYHLMFIDYFIIENSKKKLLFVKFYISDQTELCSSFRKFKSGNVYIQINYWFFGKMHKEFEEKNIEKIAELEKNKNFHQILFEIQKINNNQNNVINRLELMEHKFEKKIQDMTKLMADSLERIEKFTNNRHHQISNESDMSKNSLVESHHADKTIHNDQTENLFKNSWLNQSQRNELLPFIQKHDSEFQQNQTK
ncbi:hypothetical protein BLA29_006468 [Euroglyphus maynei]|uniref:Uncharacterized protein n=1 Tax=Euroglyphus maynei TaxID=6958 RepID=A0A1Y3BHS6_EURMA|nr:hypothetical protein BLA29_006468 [Euroglyphus maynei]